jgi:hypothetical protein
MTLIKKSDVRRHLSTKSREDRENKRLYGANATPVNSKAATDAPAVKTKPEVHAKPPAK